MKVHQREKKRAKFRISFIVLFILASFISCFVFYMKSEDSFDISQAVQEKTEEEDIIVSEMVEKADSIKTIINPVQLSDKADESYFESVFFVSGTQMKGLVDYGVIPEENCLFSDSLYLSTLSNDLFAKYDINKHDAVYIMIGKNDMSSVDKLADFDGLKQFSDKVRVLNEDIKIYIVSMLPVSAKTENEYMSNSLVDNYNMLSLQFANSIEAYYLDLNTMFVGNDGKMLESKTEADGVRLTKAAYSEVGEYILTHIGE